MKKKTKIWILLISSVILLTGLLVYGYGYYQGKINTPVQLNLRWDRAFKIPIDDKYNLIKPLNANHLQLETKTGTVIKVITAKDMPELSKTLAPMKFILKPIAVVGYGKDYFEGGFGVSFFEFYRYKLDAFLTQKGGYIGASKKFTDNFSGGVAGGIGYDGEKRVLFYVSFQF